MPNPFPAFNNTTCDGCGGQIELDDDVWIYDGEKLCGPCADDEGWICECGKFKKPEYDRCYECNQG